ncbi:MAG TPA: hypothetical protein VGW98_02290, partial [Solirubrobacteraceae bacterium]|nr:hypothetical protein [Solirubrobacteraceae bacterium]
ETIATDNSGSYASIKAPAQLSAVEPSIPTVEGNNAWISAAVGTETGYTVTATAATTKDEFTIKNEGGVVTRTCKAAVETNKGGCPAGTW